MSQIAVPIQNSEIIALVTWYYPKPFQIQYEDYSSPPGYVVRQGADADKFFPKEKILEYLETQRPGIVMPARISNIEFLMGSYEPKALKIYGTDLVQIEREIDRIPGRQYDTAEEILTDCTPYDY